MNTNAQEELISNLERAKIEKSGTLHWFHYHRRVKLVLVEVSRSTSTPSLEAVLKSRRKPVPG
jgi:hypothetical protein